jgi:large subunit ribosomal protein L25
MDAVSLAVSARTKGKAKALRRAGAVPCVLYGFGTENVALECPEQPLTKAYAKAGESTLVELDTGDKKIPVLFHEISFEPVTGRIRHVDFYAVNMKEEIETTVPIRLEGVAPAVKDLGGILVTAHDHVTVKCLPAHLPHDLPVSLESLKEFGDALTVANLHVPHDVKVLEEPATVIVLIQEPRAEEEIKPEEEVSEGEEASTGEEGGTAEGDADETSEKEAESKDKGDKS